MNRDPGDETTADVEVRDEIRVRREIDRIMQAILRLHFNYADEIGLQEGIEQALARANIENRREVVLAPRDRIDFMVGRIGIEVKVAGNADRALFQLERYANSGEIDGLLLITTRSWAAFPDCVGGKPLEVISLALTQAL